MFENREVSPENNRGQTRLIYSFILLWSLLSVTAWMLCSIMLEVGIPSGKDSIFMSHGNDLEFDWQTKTCFFFFLSKRHITHNRGCEHGLWLWEHSGGGDRHQSTGSNSSSRESSFILPIIIMIILTIIVFIINCFDHFIICTNWH